MGGREGRFANVVYRYIQDGYHVSWRLTYTIYNGSYDGTRQLYGEGNANVRRPRTWRPYQYGERRRGNELCHDHDNQCYYQLSRRLNAYRLQGQPTGWLLCQRSYCSLICRRQVGFGP